MSIRDQIIEIYEKDKQKGYRINDIMNILDINSADDYKAVAKELNFLEDEHYLALNKEYYYLAATLGYHIGKIRMNVRGFGFVEYNDESYYVNEDDTLTAMNLDEVYFQIIDTVTKEAVVVSIINRAITQFVGCVRVKKHKTMFFPDDERIARNIKITNYDEFHLSDNDKVLVKIDSYYPLIKAHIIKIIGNKYDPGVDILSILYENDINPTFSDQVMEEVKKVPKGISEQEISKRKDLRNLLTITIDGDDAKDLDDAISIEKLENTYRLYVHIADVSYYVKEGSAIDQEAYNRGTSVYVVDRVVPMLPHALCNGICSLNPQEDRLALTCMMEIDRKGELVSHEIFPSVINSDERMTYKKVNKLLVGDQELVTTYPHLMKMLLHMKVLSQILRKRREKLGAIDFDAKEGKVIVDEKGLPIDVVVRERGESEMMIEDFMIAANECVANHMKWLDLPCIYRIHEQPEPKKMRSFVKIAKILGFPYEGSISNVHPSQLQNMLNKAKNSDCYDILSSFMLRSMQKARYDNECLGHFGLGLQEYLHFTSPIRRYPDLIVHRMLRRYVFEVDHDVNHINDDHEFCEDASRQASERERNAINAERSVDDMKKAQYMEKHLGKCYDGMISGVMRFGFFVELANTVEGLVKTISLPYDKYVYDDETKTLRGLHLGHKYMIGQKVRVKCVGANHYLKEIDFELVETRKGMKNDGWKKTRRSKS